MSSINSVKNYEYSILEKKIKKLKNIKNDEKGCAKISIYTYYCLCVSF